MQKQKICLASDNFAPAHPVILKAMMEANTGYAPAYGGDSWTEEATRVIREAFKADCKVFILPTGTGANVLALMLACSRHESVLCTDIAHINYQESGAAEAIVGCKLLTVPHQGGKIKTEALLKKLQSEKAFGKHSSSPSIVSIAQPTEFGTVYTLDELKELSQFCKEHDLLFHIDGSRLYNAAVSLNISLHEMVKDIKVDLLSLGGTKNGLMGAEALVIFNPELYKGSDHLQKQTLQLMSKMRFLAAQYTPFIKTNLWEECAKNANLRAKEIATLIEAIPELVLSHPVESNQIFFRAPPSWIPMIQDKITCIHWDKEKSEIRFITSWCTLESDVHAVKTILNEIAKT